MRYFITLSYDGSAFCGWQTQPNAATVQEKLENAISTLLKSPVGVVGAGRTDSGVNAVGYVAHFDYDKVIDTAIFGYKLNAILPGGIVIHDIKLVSTSTEDSCDNFTLAGLPHARFSAKRREYTYFLHRTKDPFIERYSYQCLWALDLDSMNKAAALLLGTHDFSCFEKIGSDNRTSVCTVTEAFWKAYQPSHATILGYTEACPNPASGISREDSGPAYLYFRISADRFLRNMVRAVVGSLLEVGRGRRSIEDFAALLLPVSDASEPRSRTTEDGTPLRSLAGESVPGHALFLSHVDY